MKTITFAKPFEFEQQEHKSIDLALDALNGKDLSEAKREWAAAGNFSVMPASDMDYCAAVAARASGQPLELIQALPAPEYIKVTQAVSNFLLGAA